MKVKELLNIRQTRIVALDGKTGKVLFDTSRNKKEYYSKYNDGEVINIWADLYAHKEHFNTRFKPYIKCFVSHGSWDI